VPLITWQGILLDLLKRIPVDIDGDFFIQILLIIVLLVLSKNYLTKVLDGKIRVVEKQLMPGVPE
jgi:hypothetical protein